MRRNIIQLIILIFFRVKMDRTIILKEKHALLLRRSYNEC
jgi:hypothetical protein